LKRETDFRRFVETAPGNPTGRREPAETTGGEAMSASELKSRYHDYVVGLMRQTDSPTIPMLERIEQSIPDQESFERYIAELIDRVQVSSYPSPVMLDRIQTLLARLPDDDSKALPSSS
jgi:hypothetical protein